MPETTGVVTKWSLLRALRDFRSNPGDVPGDIPSWEARAGRLIELADGNPKRARLWLDFATNDPMSPRVFGQRDPRFDPVILQDLLARAAKHPNEATESYIVEVGKLWMNRAKLPPDFFYDPPAQDGQSFEAAWSGIDLPPDPEQLAGAAIKLFGLHRAVGWLTRRLGRADIPIAAEALGIIKVLIAEKEKP